MVSARDKRMIWSLSCIIQCLVSPMVVIISLVKKINLIRDIVPVIMANFWKVDYFLLLKNIQTIARSLG